jgi:hypothetical protein
MEEHFMHRIHSYVGSFILGAALLAPTAALAAAPITPTQDAVQVRVYDEKHKDYHAWDDHENAAWVRFQDEKKMEAPRLGEGQQARAGTVLGMAPLAPGLRFS